MSTEFQSVDPRSPRQLGRHQILTSSSPHFREPPGKKNVSEANLQPVTFTPEVKIIQLIPQVDSSEAIVELDEIQPIAMTSNGEADLDRISIGEQLLNESVALCGSGVTALPPFTLQKIIGEYDDASDGEEDDSTLVKPILHGKVMPQLSVSHDGFIQMRQYKISFDVIGSGKLSEVRIAFDSRDGQQYAIKIFSKTKLQKFNMLLRTSRNPVEEAYREAAIIRRMRHPNVIKLIELIDDPEDDNIYLVLELLEHILIEIPTETPCSESVATRYFRDIVDGVAHIHECGIVHRDLKPDNLLVSKDGIVKIVDFNICVELEKDENGQELPVDSWHGTPAFTPPECVQPDQKQTAARPLDMWSLGVTLYSMVVGDLPFKADLLPDLFDSILKDPVEFPASLAISADLRQLITGLMEKNPKDRLTMDQVRQHPWLKHCPTLRAKDQSSRLLVGFSQRCAWDDMMLEGGPEESGGSSRGDVIDLHRRGSAHGVDDEVEKLLHGYTFL